MAAAAVKEQDTQLEGAQHEAAAAAHGLEDGEHVAAGNESGVDTKLAVSGNVEAGKEEGLATATTPAAVTDIEKKRRRAERFGTDLKISEADKRKLRAARFNDGTKDGAVPADVKTGGAKVPDSSKTASAEAKSGLVAAENAKRKARAERFGSIPQELTVKPNNEASVKPNNEASVKPNNEASAKPKFSQDEEAKKKARMARFAMAAK